MAAAGTPGDGFGFQLIKRIDVVPVVPAPAAVALKFLDVIFVNTKVQVGTGRVTGVTHGTNNLTAFDTHAVSLANDYVGSGGDLRQLSLCFAEKLLIAVFIVLGGIQQRLRSWRWRPTLVLVSNSACFRARPPV